MTDPTIPRTAAGRTMSDKLDDARRYVTDVRSECGPVSGYWYDLLGLALGNIDYVQNALAAAEAGGVSVEALAKALHVALGEKHLEMAWPDCETLAGDTLAALPARTEGR